MGMSTEQTLLSLGLQLPPLPARGGLYEHAVRSGPLLFLSGKGPRRPDGSRPVGHVGEQVSAEEAREHARLAGLNLLAVLQHELGSLDRVRRVVKVLGLVNSSPEFVRHPEVIDGCSELLLQVFGPERGAHARSAFGVAALPGGMTVEIEMIVEVGDQPS